MSRRLRLMYRCLVVKMRSISDSYFADIKCMHLYADFQFFCLPVIIINTFKSRFYLRFSFNFVWPFGFLTHHHFVILTNNITMKRISRFILRTFGWNIYSKVSLEIPKAVIIMAPHTSNWDFVIGRLAFYQYGINPKILIKKEAFKPVIGPLLRWLGGIPVDRGHSQNTVKNITRQFDQHGKFYLLITPEGTRRRVERWKKGFYFIALTAKVPIFLGFLDYRKKEGGVGKLIYPSGDFEKDFKEIEAFYRGKTARNPERFNLSE